LAATLTDSHQRAIFKVCTAGFASLVALAQESLLLRGAAGIARRCALLASIRQVSLIRVELRRLIECSVWDIYFCDHPTEYAEFRRQAGKSIIDDPKRPIASAACAPTRRFFAYAQERFDSDRSGLGRAAADAMYAAYGTLSAEVHASQGLLHPDASLALAFDRYDGKVAAALEKDIRTVITSVVTAGAAIDPRRLSALDGIERGWFDWLVGTSTARTIRGGTFGIPRDPDSANPAAGH
jgi:hypothetical protein